MMSKQDQEFTRQSLWLDLVNSEFRDGRGLMADYLDDEQWVVSFLDHWGLRHEHLENQPPPEELGELRSLLRRMTQMLAVGRSPAARDMRSLNAFLAAPSFRQLVRKGTSHSVQVRTITYDWEWIRARIADSFVDAWLESPGRIKVCANVKCRWAFVDTTKGNIRRWCKDSRCSNRDRARRARQKRRESH